MYPADLKYTKDHEWIRLTNGQGRVGITGYVWTATPMADGVSEAAERRADHRPGRHRAALDRQKLYRRPGPVHWRVILPPVGRPEPA